MRSPAKYRDRFRNEPAVKGGTPLALNVFCNCALGEFKVSGHSLTVVALCRSFDAHFIAEPRLLGSDQVRIH